MLSIEGRQPSQDWLLLSSMKVSYPATSIRRDRSIDLSDKANTPMPLGFENFADHSLLSLNIELNNIDLLLPLKINF